MSPIQIRSSDTHSV